MIAILPLSFSLPSFRARSRASLEFELIV
jgi:hypothetical protein